MALGGKYLTFSLDSESYGIDVLQVREIIRLTTITPVPQMPPYVRGVINLRGKIIRVVDLRELFHYKEAAHTDQTCIVVVQVKLAQGKAAQTGLIVDRVEDVLNIASGDIELPPDFAAELSGDFILGIAKVKGGVKTLLKLENVLGSELVAQPLAA